LQKECTVVSFPQAVDEAELAEQADSGQEIFTKHEKIVRLVVQDVAHPAQGWATGELFQLPAQDSTAEIDPADDPLMKGWASARSSNQAVSSGTCLACTAMLPPNPADRMSRSNSAGR